MTLTVWLPTEVLLKEEVSSIKAEADDGWFGILPKHIDFVTSLVPGIMTFRTPSGVEQFVAVDQGILVKCGQDVWVSTRNGVRGSNIDELQKNVEDVFQKREETEKQAHASEAKLEADLVRNLLESQKNG